MAAISLVIEEKPQVWVPVTLKAPIDGSFSQFQISLLVELEDNDKITELVTKALEDGDNGDRVLLEHTVKGWEGIGSSRTKELQFSEDNLKMMMAKGWILGPCALAVMDAHRGIIEELEKN